MVSIKFIKAFCPECGEKNGEFMVDTKVKCVKCDKYFTVKSKSVKK